MCCVNSYYLSMYRMSILVCYVIICIYSVYFSVLWVTTSNANLCSSHRANSSNHLILLTVWYRPYQFLEPPPDCYFEFFAVHLILIYYFHLLFSFICPDDGKVILPKRVGLTILYYIPNLITYSIQYACT